MQCCVPGFKAAWHCKFQHALPLSHIRPSHTMQQENQYRGSFWDTPGRISAVFWISKIKTQSTSWQDRGLLVFGDYQPLGWLHLSPKFIRWRWWSTVSTVCPHGDGGGRAQWVHLDWKHLLCELSAVRGFVKFLERGRYGFASWSLLMAEMCFLVKISQHIACPCVLLWEGSQPE